MVRKLLFGSLCMVIVSALFLSSCGSKEVKVEKKEQEVVKKEEKKVKR
jgi:uncharacterized protein YcfL